MNSNRHSSFLLIAFAVGAAIFEPAGYASEPNATKAGRGQNGPYGIPVRKPWTTANVTGTPEPPPPFRAERVFPKISFKSPTVITNAPGTRRLFVAEQSGKIYSIPDDPACDTPDLLLDVNELVDRLNKNKANVGFTAVYGLTFHPDFAKNRFCYVCYVVNHKDGGRGQHPDGTRVSRLRVSKTDPPRCDPDSEQVVITWLQGGHNGGCLKFGHDGCLYISTGDGGLAFPPDGRKSGQDVSNLLSSILRIDVDRREGDRPYAIPADNPFVKLKEARGEIWAYGLRNPWKMSFDRKTGELWVGDVGWELWELVYRVRPGDNYGWSLVEGRQPVHAERKRGPTPIVRPTIEIPHTDGASVTGGFVYRGKKFKELVGQYIFGDWETRFIWGVYCDGKKLGPRRELVEPTVRIVGFAEDNEGELYLLDYDNGTIHTLVRNDVKPSNRKFPRRLSETGLFSSVPAHRLADGVIPFSINSQQWADHTSAQRLIAVPGTGSITLHPKPERITGSMFHRKMDFPKDTVLAKTISLQMQHGKPDSRRRLETQILHFDGRLWRGYSYEWNNAQTDAALVGSAGKNRTFVVQDSTAPGGRRTQTWHFSSRTECIRCHNPWAEHTLAFNIPQLNKDHDYGNVTDNQLRAFRHAGLLAEAVEDIDPDDPFAKDRRPNSPSELSRLADPFDPTGDLDRRSRSYLHVNCSHCHRFNGGGAAYILLQYDKPLVETGALAVRPTQGTFGIHDAQILAPGDPYRSVLYYRMAKLGGGRMPHLGSKLVDERGLRLIHDWIRQLPMRPKDTALIDRLIALDESTVLAREQADRPKTLRRLARQIARNDDRKKTNNEDRRQAKIRAEREAATRARKRNKDRLQLIDDLLSTTSRALLLAATIKRNRLPTAVRGQTIAVAVKRPEPQIRDLFEQFVPDEQRSKRLGDVIRPSQILALAGDTDRGQQLFHNTAGVQCKNCHKIGKDGKQVGPELDRIAKKYKRFQLLESILEPSKNIDPKYVTWLVETKAGRVHTGLLVKKTDTEIVLKDAKNQQIRIALNDVEQMVPQRKSMMPELLLRDLTAEQVADLLAYLESLR